jgi:hypothetical protein
MRNEFARKKIACIKAYNISERCVRVFKKKCKSTLVPVLEQKGGASLLCCGSGDDEEGLPRI